MQSMTSLDSRFSLARTHEALQTLIGFALLWACAQIVIPLNPIPVTLQTMAVMLIGLTFKTRPALSAVTLYLFAGTIGVPVFGEWSGGFLKLVGPSGGYLVGFFAAVLAMTTWRKFFTSESFLNTLANCAIGTVIVFFFGVAWLSRFVGIPAAFELGLLPFILPGAIKALLLCGSLQFLRTRN